MDITEDIMNKVEILLSKVYQISRYCTELPSNSLTSYIPCNVYYRFVLRNKYYNRGVFCRCVMNLPFRVSEWNNPLITLQGKGIDFSLDAPTSPLVRNTKPCQVFCIMNNIYR